jgi:TonB-dependent SusC/RagA subfamily outer membrane receptor
MTLKHLPILALLLAGCASSAPMPRNDEARSPAASLEDLLEDEIRSGSPGVRVFRDMGGIRIRIRGSLVEPLYVVDGIPLSSSAVLSGLSPFDVEDVEVLTDPARLALYGIRGGKGVVLISTKRP